MADEAEHGRPGVMKDDLICPGRKKDSSDGVQAIQSDSEQHHRDMADHDNHTAPTTTADPQTEASATYEQGRNSISAVTADEPTYQAVQSRQNGLEQLDQVEALSEQSHICQGKAQDTIPIEPTGVREHQQATTHQVSEEVSPARLPEEEQNVSSTAQARKADKPPATLPEAFMAGRCLQRDSTEDDREALKPDSGLRFPHHRSSHASSIASNTTVESSEPEPTTIYGVVLVGFNHSLGPIVDYSYPPYLKDDEDIAKSLPFLALPDGAHMHDEDYSCFHLYLPDVSACTVYGISCIRQLRADELLRKSADITRSTVQKAVVVLANKPIFGPIRDKLGVITRAFFAQRDFEETEILEHFYHSLVHALKDEEQTDETAISMGVSVREIVWKFRMQTLTLFKLLLLQKRVMFYSSQVERLCSFQYALVSLVPLLLLNLDDAADPSLDSRSSMLRKASSLRSSDRKSLLAYLGLPLNLFGKGAFFQPYLPLQQLEMLKSTSYLVGATNSIFQSQRDCPIDVVVNLETATIDFLNPKVASMVGLTAADRKWMDDIVRSVESTWNPSDPQRPVGMGYKASDDWLRSKFEEYLTSALSAIKFVDFLVRNQDMSILINPNDPSGLNSFNESWLANFRSTPAFEAWNKHTDPVIFDLVEPKHPCEGQAHVIEDVGIRLVNGLHDLHLDERLGPTQEAISKGIATGSEGVWKLYSSVRTDLAKRQAEYRERREREEAAKPAPTADSLEAKLAENERPQLISDHVLAGAAEVGGRAANLATNIGSFFGSRLTKQRSVGHPSGEERAGPSTMNASSVTSPQSQTDPSTSRPRPGLFSSFRSVSSSAPSGPLPEESNSNKASGDSNSLASPPPIASSFGSFFRRSSSIPSNQTVDSSATSSISRHPVRQASDLDSGVLALPDDYEDGALVWSEEKLAFIPVDSKASSKASHVRNSHSVGSERSDNDTMSDVKL